jgi:hypothetical protein
MEMPTHRRRSTSSACSHAACATLLALSMAACGSGGAASTSGAGGTGAGQGGSTGTGTGGAGTGGAAGNGSTGTGSSGASGGTTGSDASVPIVGDAGGVFACTPGVEQLVITDCGYPTTTSNPLTSTVFNENEVFRAIRPAGAWPNGVVQMFYNDEHAMTLGVRSVVVKSSSGTTTTDYPVTALTTDPGSSTSPQTGTNMLVGDQSGLDPSLRPMWPSLFITDISTDPSNRSGDWQMGGVPTAPNAIFGSWKAAVRNVDNTKTPSVVSITPDMDPAKNNWNLAGGDTPPSGLANEGYGAEARWNVQLQPGHSYRLQVLVHDGDQNKGGGDSGEACVLFCAGAGACTGSECSSTGTGGSGGGTPQCPSGTTACTSGGPDGPTCASGTVCANGCCLIYVN